MILKTHMYLITLIYFAVFFFPYLLSPIEQFIFRFNAVFTVHIAVITQKEKRIFINNSSAYKLLDAIPTRSG